MVASEHSEYLPLVSDFTLQAPETQVVSNSSQVPKVAEEFLSAFVISFSVSRYELRYLYPKSRSLPDGSQLLMAWDTDRGHRAVPVFAHE